MSAEADIDRVLDVGASLARRRVIAGALLVAGALAAMSFAGAFELRRYAGALRTVATLFGDALPPDFSRWRRWVHPLIDTLAMSIGSTTLGALGAIIVAPLAGRRGPSQLVGRVVRLGLEVLRSVPGIIWGVIFVAAVGFGPLPGMLALATHSVGTLGRLYAETLEHVLPGPGLALEAQGVSRLGVLRFALLPQVLPRLADATFYRWEHNLRAATALGLVGAGGLGLELSTAFHLFEYREAAALIAVIVVWVSLFEALAAWARRHLSSGADGSH